MDCSKKMETIKLNVMAQKEEMLGHDQVVLYTPVLV